MKIVLAAMLLAGAVPANARTLIVCADPNNLPFSNQAERGFENKIVRIVAADLGAEVRYLWWAQRRGNVRETLNAGKCDLIPGVGSSLDMVATTRPYYRSAYQVLTRDPALKGLASLDDPRLARLRLGVQLIGDDGSNTPPAHALTRRGYVGNVRGYPVYGDYDSPAPQAGIVEALAMGDIDVAFVWGPTGGYFARQSRVPISLTTIEPLADGPALPMAFDVSMGVRRDNVALRRELDAALDRHRPEIAAILREFGVPTL